jgi:hypothetical protein
MKKKIQIADNRMNVLNSWLPCNYGCDKLSYNIWFQLFFQAILIFDKNYLNGSQLGAPL